MTPSSRVSPYSARPDSNLTNVVSGAPSGTAGWMVLRPRGQVQKVRQVKHVP
jgi:hypothetical protein